VLITLLIKSTHIRGQTLVKSWSKPLTSKNVSITFATHSKFHLNTSNSPNTKVVQFFMGHNFHVEWHFKFELENGEKPRSTPLIPIHQSREKFKVCEQFM
jgi:hypothetical protein